MSPVSQSDGHDLPGLVDECVPGVAAEGDDVVIGPKDPVGEPVLAHELPQVLDRVQLWRSGREEQEGDVVGHRQLRGRVPAGLIKKENGVGTMIHRLADLVQVRVHGFGIAEGQHQACPFALAWADGAKEIGPHRALITGR